MLEHMINILSSCQESQLFCFSYLLQFSDLESFQRVVEQFNTTISEARADYRSDTNGSLTNYSQLMSQLFCGRTSTFIGEEPSSLEKAAQDELASGEGEEEEEVEDVEEVLNYVYQNDTSKLYCYKIICIILCCRFSNCNF